MRTNYNDSSKSGGRYPKRQSSGGGRNGGSNGGSSNGGARRPQGRRPGGHSNGGTINASGATAARNKYLELAKEALSNGNRVEAENYYQHAEHYSKLLSAAMENRREREESQPESGNGHRRNNHYSEPAQEATSTQEPAPAQHEPTVQEPVVAEPIAGLPLASPE